jgi:hypothetical protein
VGEQRLVQGGGAGRWVCGVVKSVDGAVRYCGVPYAMCVTSAALRGMLRAVPYRVCQANIDLRCPGWYTSASLVVVVVQECVTGRPSAVCTCYCCEHSLTHLMVSCVAQQADAHPSRALNVLSNVPSCVGDGPVSWLTVLHGVLAMYL